MRVLKMVLFGTGWLILGVAATASASPLMYVSVLGSTTQNGTYTNSVTAPGGTPIYYELTLTAAPTTNTNSHTTVQTDGVHDSVNSVPFFSITDALGDFTSASENSTWAVGSGNEAAISGGGTVLTVRAFASNGNYVNVDSPQVLVTGMFTTNSQGSSESLTGAYTSSTGAFKLGVNSSGIFPNSTTEGSSDPYLGYLPLSISSTPEPASLSLLGLGAVAMMRRRRSGTIAGAKA